MWFHRAGGRLVEEAHTAHQQQLCYNTNLKFVGNRSTITQYTVLMPREVSASNIHDKIKFSIEFRTKYNPNVTAAATTKLNTEHNYWRNQDK